MANTSITVQQVTFQFLDASTECYIYYKSDEPGNPFWGGNDARHKSFSRDTSMESILPEIHEFLHWEQVCKTCHRPKDYYRIESTGASCADYFHVDLLEETMKAFKKP